MCVFFSLFVPEFSASEFRLCVSTAIYFSGQCVPSVV